ncbi:DUF308 domain-containing protein, partial [Citrobacter portucalensis]
MFVFNQRSLRAFNEKTLVHYKKHATIMAVLMLICGICCLIYPIAAGVYLSYATGFMFLVCGFYSIYSLFSSGKKQLKAKFTGNDSNLLIVFYVQIMPDDFVMQLHR